MKSKNAKTLKKATKRARAKKADRAFIRVRLRFYGLEASLTKWRELLIKVTGNATVSPIGLVPQRTGLVHRHAFEAELTTTQRQKIAAYWTEPSGTGHTATDRPYRWNDCIGFEEVGGAEPGITVEEIRNQMAKARANRAVPKISDRDRRVQAAEDKRAIELLEELVCMADGAAPRIAFSEWTASTLLHMIQDDDYRKLIRDKHAKKYGD